MAMLDASGITAVRRYLESEFPDSAIHDYYDSDRDSQCFCIGDGPRSHLATVTHEFFLYCATSHIDVLLRRWQLAQTLREAGRSRVIVTSKGLQVESS